jgi:hypothetical protein
MRNANGVIHADVDRFSSIAPACDNYSDCLSGCYRIHQKYCFVDKKTGNKGVGAAGVQFWKWMLESGTDVAASKAGRCVGRQ